jgi:hypothetical protein
MAAVSATGAVMVMEKGMVLARLMAKAVDVAMVPTSLAVV